MDRDKYYAELRRLEGENRQNLLDLANWAEQSALPWLWDELAGMAPDKHVSALRDYDAIRQGLQTTYADHEKMPLKLNFYVAQLSMMDAEVKQYGKAIRAFSGTSQPPYADVTIETLHRALNSHLRHGVVLLEQAGHALLDLPTVYGAWSRRKEHPFEIFKGAEQHIYGAYSWMTHADRAPYAPVAVLRTAIELRIRGAFGIQGYIDENNNSLVPIDLGRVFDAIRPHLSKLEFAVEFHDVVRIYRWSNFYLHAGWRDFEWVPGFALQYLRPLFADQKTSNGGWSIDGGIRMPRSVWRDIRNHFERAGRGEDKPWIQQALKKISSLLTGRKARNLKLNEADEQSALCVFLD